MSVGRGTRTICNGVFEDGDEPSLCRKAWDPGGGLRLVRKRTFLGERTDGGREGWKERERKTLLSWQFCQDMK